MHPDAIELSPQDGQSLLILQGALALGVFLFAAVVVGLTRTDPAQAATPDTLKSVQILSGGQALLAIQSFAAGLLLFPKLAGPQRVNAVLEGVSDPQQRVHAVLGVVRGAVIVRAALFEGPALMAIAVVFLAHTWGVLAEHPWVWLNLASPLAFFLLTAVVFVTPARLRALVAERLPS